VNHGSMLLSTVVFLINCGMESVMLAPSLGNVLRQAREVRELTAFDAARAAGISAAYLSKLENDAVKKPSPLVLHQLSEALMVPYAELMRLTGYRVPGDQGKNAATTVGAALFADLTDDEREELVEYLAWYRARRRVGRSSAATARA
jgi:HTH-type transcriptional regulator, competence development regulator